MNAEDKFNPIRKGLLELVVLKVIAAHKVYAADIIKHLSGTEFATQEGTLYPLLSRLRRDGIVAYEWAESDAGPPRKYYELTDLGRTQLFQLDQYWNSLHDTIKTITQEK